MKKLLLLVAFVGSLTCLYFYLKAPATDPLYVSSQNQILPKPVEKQESEAMSMVREINARNANVRTLYCDSVSIELSRRVKVTVTGTMAMEKEKRFRMILNSKIGGKEMDVGSNDNYFWFWSKRMDPPVLHYARHEDLPKTKMKTALNPIWMMESMNFGGIDTEGAQVGSYKQFYIVLQPRTASTGQQVTAVTLIDPTKKAVVGRYLYNQSEKMIASSEVKSFQNVNGHTVPKEMLIIWYEEGLRLDMMLGGARVNVGIEERNWSMPTSPNSIDMGK